METVLISDIINLYNMIPPVSLPDHSIISGRFVTSFFDLGKSLRTEKPQVPALPVELTRPPKKNLSHMESEFMLSDEVMDMVHATISKLDAKISSKREIDILWDKTKSIV